jgi:hypothetical protein
VISVSGEEVVHFAHDHWLHDGLWGYLMRWLSFTAVHCPTEKIKTHAWRFLETIHPVVARYYRFGGIEHLAGEN